LLLLLLVVLVLLLMLLVLLCSHLLPQLETYISLCLSNLEVPQLTEPNMSAANNAVWSLGELMIKASGAG
jgi:hypothetical protein